MKKNNRNQKFALTITALVILAGLTQQHFAIKAALADTPPAVSEVAEDQTCIQLKKAEGGYIGSSYCAPRARIDAYVTGLNAEIEKLKAKTIKASISMYSRLDSCHNPSEGKCLTAAGRDTKEGSTIACPRSVKLGTRVKINGHIYTCDDRTAKWVEATFGGTYDIFTEDQGSAIAFGRKTLDVTFVD